MFNANEWTESSWREASDKTDSRHEAKQDAIREAVRKVSDGKKLIEAANNDRFESDLTELAGPAVYAGLERTRAVGGSKSAAYARGYDIWKKSLEENN